MAKKVGKRGVGRPKVNAPEMTERFMIRCSPADLARWSAAAEKLGLAVGQWIRMVANQAEPK